MYICLAARTKRIGSGGFWDVSALCCHCTHNLLDSRFWGADMMYVFYFILSPLDYSYIFGSGGGAANVCRVC